MTETTAPPLSIAIALFDRVTMLDAIGPYSVLAGLPNSEITFVAEQPGPVTDSNGRMSVVAHAAYRDMPNPDVIVIPGGVITVPMSREKTHPIIDWIAQVHPGTTKTTSVCTGSQLLGAAGVLDGVPATSHWYVRDTLTEFGAIPTDERRRHPRQDHHRRRRVGRHRHGTPARRRSPVRSGGAGHPAEHRIRP